MGQTGRASRNPIKKSSRRVWERSGQGVTMLSGWTMDFWMDLLKPRRAENGGFAPFEQKLLQSLDRGGPVKLGVI